MAALGAKPRLPKPPIVVLQTWCWLPFALALLAGGWQAWQASRRPINYVALAYLVPALRNLSTGEKAPPEEFFQAAETLLKSDEMRQLARAQMQRFQPEITEGKVEIQPRPKRDENKIVVVAFGTAPQYTSPYLNALLDQCVEKSNAVGIGERSSVIVKMTPQVIGESVARAALGFIVGTILLVILCVISLVRRRHAEKRALGA